MAENWLDDLMASIPEPEVVKVDDHGKLPPGWHAERIGGVLHTTFVHGHNCATRVWLGREHLCDSNGAGIPIACIRFLLKEQGDESDG